MRLDQILVQLGLAPSRTKAQDLIKSRAVEVFDGKIWKTLSTVSEDGSRYGLPERPENLRLQGQEILKYVSRGGLKLEGALKQLNLSVQDFVCLDCGQSTGGFTDCLLQAGARKVVGFDVGHDQLAFVLKAHPQVIAIEGLHFKEAVQHAELKNQTPKEVGFDLIVADLSFVSLEKVMPVFANFGKRLLALVKPQFEVGADHLNKNGIVKDAALYEQVQARVRQTALDCGWTTLDYFPSQVEGRDGNQEFFLFAERPPQGETR